MSDSFHFEITNYRESALEKAAIGKKIKTIVWIESQLKVMLSTYWGLYRAEDEQGKQLLLEGKTPYILKEGFTYQVEGKVKLAKGEKRLEVQSVKLVRPVTSRGMIGWLQQQDGLFRNAEMLYDLYGDSIWEVMRHSPEELGAHLNEYRKEMGDSWQENQKITEYTDKIIDKLVYFGLTTKQAHQFWGHYGLRAIEELKSRPYEVLQQTLQLSFSKIDAISKKIGYPSDGGDRLQAALYSVLIDMENDGHCYLPISVWMDSTQKLLKSKITIDTLLLHAEALRLEEKWIKEADRAYLPALYEAEWGIAKEVRRLANYKELMLIDPHPILDVILHENNYQLEQRQKEAVLTIANTRGGIYILNGNAGSGKTFTLKLILQTMEEQYRKENRQLIVEIFAPTGKASQVVAKATGYESQTLHRGLGYNPDSGFRFRMGNPLGADVVVVDETSMMDVFLTFHLLMALRTGTKLILLGDTKQLPSVGPGNVLHDFINCGIISVTTLNVVKRQSEHSGIIKNAQRIIDRTMITTEKTLKDAYVARKATANDAIPFIINNIHQLLTIKKMKLEDIQILAPQRSGPLGTQSLNYIIQQEFNAFSKTTIGIAPKQVEYYNVHSKLIEKAELCFYKGDKVIHLRNRYDMAWYKRIGQDMWERQYNMDTITNGETGIIVDILNGGVYDGFRQRIIVKYENFYVFYDDQFQDLEHAYALTIHKSQGSQWKAVIIPVIKEHNRMWDNALLYTGYTRAQKYVLVLGDEESIRRAIASFASRERFTYLTERLKA
jgi:exodeoxyribonuclease V alpha subunit